jgi:hypothetical protein
MVPSDQKAAQRGTRNLGESVGLEKARLRAHTRGDAEA